MHHIDVAEAGGGDVRDALLAEGVGHASDLHTAHHTAEVEHILLGDGEAAVGDEPAKVVSARFLLPSGDGDLESVGDDLCFVVPIERDWLLVKGVLIFLHQLADGDRPLRQYKSRWRRRR